MMEALCTTLTTWSSDSKSKFEPILYLTNLMWNPQLLGPENQIGMCGGSKRIPDNQKSHLYVKHSTFQLLISAQKNHTYGTYSLGRLPPPSLLLPQGSPQRPALQGPCQPGSPWERKCRYALQVLDHIYLSTIELLQLFLATSQDGCVVLKENFLTALNNLQPPNCDVLGVSQTKPDKIEHLLMCTVQVIC